MAKPKSKRRPAKRNNVDKCKFEFKPPKSCPLYKKRMNDPVNHPNHYNMTKYEVIDVLEEWFADKPLLWQAVKYIARAEYKGAKNVDLQKAIFYLNREIVKTEKN